MLKKAQRRFLSRPAMRFAKKTIVACIIAVFVLGMLNQFETIEFGYFEGNDNLLCPQNHQPTLYYIANNLKVQLIVEESTIVIVLTNEGREVIFNCPWEIYFSIITIPMNPRFTSNKFKVTHVNGFLFKLQPNIQLQQNTIIFHRHGVENITALCRLPSKYFAFPNWFITGPSLTSMVIVSTSTEVYPEMVIANSTFKNSYRFQLNDRVRNKKKIPLVAKLVIPTPLNVTRVKESLDFVKISSDWIVTFNDSDLTREADLLEDYLGTSSTLTSLATSTKKMISLNLVKELRYLDSKMRNNGILASSEAYQLLTFADKVVIDAKTPTGIFYGIQTLFSLCRSDISPNKNEKWIPALNITDAPKYKYRGLMIDVARHFLKPNFIKKMITAMSTYKMNYLHLHLTDDEGWRIEMPDFKELTSIGANPTVKYGSKPKFDFLNAYLGAIPTDINNSKTVQRQYYSQSDYRRILRHAMLHHVTVIPEIDFPGHSHAALVSMRARKRLHNTDVSIEDEQDTSEDGSINNVADTVINPCKSSTLDFMTSVVKTMILYHQGIQPLKMIHLGGDEVSEGALVQSPICTDLLENENTQLRTYVLKKLLEIGFKLDITVVLWESNHRETDFGNFTKPIIHFWLPSDDNIGVLNNYLKAGLEVIISDAKVFYLDHSYEPCIFENGLRWATNHVDEFQIFRYRIPDPCSDDVPGCSEMKDRIIGIQANLWGEMILKEETAEEMLFPRLLAVAERAWHQAPWQKNPNTNLKELKDWLSFSSAIVQREFATFEELDINYRISPPGARLVNGELQTNTLLPGLEVMASSDGGETWKKPGTDVKGEVLLASVSPSGKKRSRIIKLIEPNETRSHIVIP